MPGKMRFYTAALTTTAWILPSFAVAQISDSPESVLAHYWNADAAARSESASSSDNVDRQVYAMHRQSLEGGLSVRSRSLKGDISESIKMLNVPASTHKRVVCGNSICEVVLVVTDVPENGEIVRNVVVGLNEVLQKKFNVLTPSIITEGPGGRGVSALYYIKMR